LSTLGEKKWWRKIISRVKWKRKFVSLSLSLAGKHKNIILDFHPCTTDDEEEKMMIMCFWGGKKGHDMLGKADEEEVTKISKWDFPPTLSLL
jgi:hypothetical protein